MKVLTCSKTRELSNMYSNIPDRALSASGIVSVGKTSVQKIIILTLYRVLLPREYLYMPQNVKAAFDS